MWPRRRSWRKPRARLMSTNRFYDLLPEGVEGPAARRPATGTGSTSPASSPERGIPNVILHGMLNAGWRAQMFTVWSGRKRWVKRVGTQYR